MGEVSSLDIRFSTPMPVGSSIQFKKGATLINYNVVGTRTAPNQIQTGGTLSAFINNFDFAIRSDYKGVLNSSILGGDTFRVSATNTTDLFSDGAVFGTTGVVFEYRNFITAPTITGISGNYYLINNDIMVSLSAVGIGGYFRIRFENLTNGKNTTYITAEKPLSGDGNAVVNISPYLKSIFSYPKHSDEETGVVNSNLAFIRMTVEYVQGSSSSSTQITKWYLRGGRRTHFVNQAFGGAGAVLIPNALEDGGKLPIWANYPIILSMIQDGGGVNNLNIINVPNPDPSVTEMMREKGCESVYVKFLNQYGGYSAWLFENYTETESNTALGTYIRHGGAYKPQGNVPNTGFTDLGHESNISLSLSSKVPERYMSFIHDLIVSPEIYIYDDGNWLPVASTRNSIAEESNRRAYNVKINFEKLIRFNPSIIWSNS